VFFTYELIIVDSYNDNDVRFTFTTSNSRIDKADKYRTIERIIK